MRYNLGGFRAMSWFRRILGGKAHPESPHGYLCERPHWRVVGVKVFSPSFRELPSLVPKGSVLYIENTRFDRDVNEFLVPRAVEAPRGLVRAGTIWPKPKFFHVPITQPDMQGLAELSERHAEPEVADHMVVYRESTILLEWYDAGFDPIFLSKEIDEKKVKVFCAQGGAKYDEFP